MVEDKLFKEVSRRYYEAPFIRSMGIELTGVEPGVARSKLKITDEQLQQDGFVHAGVVSTLADHTGGAAGWTLVPPHFTVLTVEFKIHFLNPARGPELTCVSKVLRGGKRLTTCESEVFNPDGTLAAKLTMTLANVETAKLK